MLKPILAVATPLLIAGSSVYAAQEPRVTKKVEVNGKRYRVVTQGKAVMVANKSLLVVYGVDERDDQREAVRVATGCKVVDELPSNDAKLRGKLECPTDGAR